MKEALWWKVGKKDEYTKFIGEIKLVHRKLNSKEIRYQRNFIKISD